MANREYHTTYSWAIAMFDGLAQTAQAQGANGPLLIAIMADGAPLPGNT
jgi:hypothetical protein